MKCENCICTFGFIKSKDIYGAGEIKRGMREMNHRPSSVYSQQITYRHLGHQLWFAICEGTTGHDQKVIERPGGRIVCDGRPVSLLLRSINTVRSEWDFNLSCYHFAIITLGNLEHYSYFSWRIFESHKSPSGDGWNIINAWEWLNNVSLSFLHFISVNIYFISSN